MPIDALRVLCAQLTRDLLAIAKFLLNATVTNRHTLKMVPFESLGTVSYLHPIATLVVSLAVSEIFSVK